MTAVACDLCTRPLARWVRMAAESTSETQALRVCEACKTSSEKHHAGRYTFVPIRVPEPAALTGAGTPLRLIDDPAAPVGHDHPETAKAAAKRALPRSGSNRRRAYEAIQRAGGLTAEEVGKALRWPHQTYSAAVSTLARDGWLRETDARRNTDAGNPAIVYEVVEAL